MARPKKGTKEGKIATEKWKKTMVKKYGSITNKMREIGRIGGQNGKGPDYKGGFAGNPELARKAGAKGGKISRRGPSNKTQKLIDANYTKISLMVMDNHSVKDIAEETGIPKHLLYKFIREEIRG